MANGRKAKVKSAPREHFFCIFSCTCQKIFVPLQRIFKNVMVISEMAITKTRTGYAIL